MVLGGMPGTAYAGAVARVLPGSSIFLMSDGVYEISRPDGAMWSFAGLVEHARYRGGPLRRAVRKSPH